MKQFCIGDKIKYGSYGECRITDIREENIGGRVRDFYVLAQSKSSSTILVPVEKANCFKEICPPLTFDEIKALSSAMTEIDWTKDDKSRGEVFKDIFNRDDVSEIAGTLLSILSRQKALKLQRKKLRTTDLNALRTCERILFEELSRTLALREEDVTPILQGNLEPQLK